MVARFGSEAEHGMEVEEVDSPVPKIQSASLDIFDMIIEGSQDVCRNGNEKQN